MSQEQPSFTPQEKFAAAQAALTHAVTDRSRWVKTIESILDQLSDVRAALLHWQAIEPISHITFGVGIGDEDGVYLTVGVARGAEVFYGPQILTEFDFTPVEVAPLEAPS